jgi:hypothetical protein
LGRKVPGNRGIARLSGVVEALFCLIIGLKDFEQRRRRSMRFLTAFLVLFTVSLSASQIETLTFQDVTPVIERDAQYDRIILPGHDLLSRPGEPELPVRSLTYALPRGMEAAGVRTVQATYEVIPGTYRIAPVQPQAILPIPGQDVPSPGFVPEKEGIYRSSAPYPASPIELGGSGNLGGQALSQLTVHPLRYFPQEGRLERLVDLTFEVETRPADRIAASPRYRSKSASRVHRDVLRSLVVNPEDLEPGGSLQMLPEGGFEYLIVCHSALESAMQPLADWKTQKGCRAVVRTVGWITDNYSGWDNAEKIRTYIHTCYQDSGLTYVLLAGDPLYVPDRIAYAMTCEAGIHYDEDSIHADLYYSDLDGDWDANGNHIYGEVDDSVDLYPDVFVGRAPLGASASAENFVDKILTYETDPPTDYLNDALFFAEILWSEPYTNSALNKELIDSLYLVDEFVVEKLYEDWGNEDRTAVLNAINAGKNLLNHNGHGWYSVMGVGPGSSLGPSDMDNLQNGDRQGIMYSIGCWVGAFDYDAISEHYINSTSGGGVAFVCNNRYGWGSPGNPLYGISDRFDAELYRMLFPENLNRIGVAVASDKAWFVPRSGEENVYRIHQYQLTLLGEPEMNVWTGGAKTFSVAFPETIPDGSQVPYTVYVEGPGGPVPGAQVCLMGDDDYLVDFTDLSGTLTLTPSPGTPGEMTLTVTSRNFLPFVGETQVMTEGPYAAMESVEIQDASRGNGDGCLNPGEQVMLSVTLKNAGSVDLENLQATLRSDDDAVTLIDTVYDYGTLASGDTLTNDTGLEFSVSSSTENGDAIPFTLHLAADGGYETEHEFGVVVAEPRLEFLGYEIVGADTVFNPGDALNVGIEVMNKGLAPASGAEAILMTSDPHLDFPCGNTLTFGDLGSNATGLDTLEMEIDGSAPEPHLIEIEVHLCTSEGDSSVDGFLLQIGPRTYEDDFEDGAPEWSIEAPWHLTDHRPYSGDSSFYCGLDGSWTYGNEEECALLSPSFVVGPWACFGFRAWYEVTIYGVDGLYVELDDGSGFQTLDFIGSGGALLPIQSTWLTYEYDVSYVPPGDTIQVRLTFVSDDDMEVAEGFYIDDFYVQASTFAPGVTEEGSREILEPLLFRATPNPSRGAASLRYQLPRSSNVELDLFDGSGRRIASLDKGERSAGVHTVRLDGLHPGEGRRLPAGVYFVHLTVDGRIEGREKLILLR